tara:strand:- start:1274 stop:1387 length:114 start_codon:yes stop_codon:yes gene_type:complete
MTSNAEASITITNKDKETTINAFHLYDMLSFLDFFKL